MTASPQANRFIGGIGVQKKIVSNGCMSHVVPLQYPAFSCIFLQIPMFQNCHEVIDRPTVGVNTDKKQWGLLMLQIDAACVDLGDFDSKNSM